MGINIIGAVEVARSFVFKITGDANPNSGMGKFETKEFFCSYKATAMPDDAPDVSAYLYQIAERDVMEAAHHHINFTRLPVDAPIPAPPIPTPVEQTQAQPGSQPPTPAPSASPYVVSEKQDTTKTKSVPKQDENPKKTPSAIIADRLAARGVTKEEIVSWVRRCYPDSVTRKLSQEEYVNAFTEAEAAITSSSIEAFRGLLTVTTGDQGDVFTDDPAVRSAMGQVAAKWPAWSPELTKVAALWCADQVKDAGALEAFLIAGGVTDQTPPGRIESFLAISRHMAMSAGKDILELSKKTGNPLGMIEADISREAGKSIRFALDLPKNRVYEIFTAMVEKTKGAKK